MKRDTKYNLQLKVGYPIIDHVRQDRKEKCIRSFPYTPSMESFARLIDFCLDNGLTFYVGPDKEYNPDACVEIRISEVDRKLSNHQFFEEKLLEAKKTLTTVCSRVAERKRTMDFIHAVNNADAWLDRVRYELELIERGEKHGTSSYFKREV